MLNESIESQKTTCYMMGKYMWTEVACGGTGNEIDISFWALKRF